MSSPHYSHSNQKWGFALWHWGASMQLLNNHHRYSPQAPGPPPINTSCRDLTQSTITLINVRLRDSPVVMDMQGQGSCWAGSLGLGSFARSRDPMVICGPEPEQCAPCTGTGLPLSPPPDRLLIAVVCVKRWAVWIHGVGPLSSRLEFRPRSCDGQGRHPGGARAGALRAPPGRRRLCGGVASTSGQSPPPR